LKQNQPKAEKAFSAQGKNGSEGFFRLLSLKSDAQEIFEGYSSLAFSPISQIDFGADMVFAPKVSE